MIVTIDAGNTNIESGIFPEEDGNETFIATFRIGTNKCFTTDELGVSFKEMIYHNGIDPKTIKAGVFSSVVPNINHSIAKMLYKYFNCEPFHITYEHFKELTITYENPASLGTDRLVNAYSAICIYSPPVIVIDFGTATTFCAVSSKNEYLGGVILPGIGISLDALVHETSMLPKVELGYPEGVIQKDTVRGMQAGIYFSTVAAVDGIVCRMKKEMAEDVPVKVIATGGLSHYIARASNEIDTVDNFLSLKGLKLLYDSLSH